LPLKALKKDQTPNHTPKLQAKPYAKVTGQEMTIRESYRRNHTPKLQAEGGKSYAKVTGGSESIAHKRYRVFSLAVLSLKCG
jgi:hypothetical protein